MRSNTLHGPGEFELHQHRGCPSQSRRRCAADRGPLDSRQTQRIRHQRAVRQPPEVRVAHAQPQNDAQRVPVENEFRLAKREFLSHELTRRLGRKASAHTSARERPRIDRSPVPPSEFPLSSLSTQTSNSPHFLSRQNIVSVVSKRGPLSQLVAGAPPDRNRNNGTPCDSVRHRSDAQTNALVANVVGVAAIVSSDITEREISESRMMWHTQDYLGREVVCGAVHATLRMCTSTPLWLFRDSVPDSAGRQRPIDLSYTECVRRHSQSLQNAREEASALRRPARRAAVSAGGRPGPSFGPSTSSTVEAPATELAKKCKIASGTANDSARVSTQMSHQMPAASSARIPRSRVPHGSPPHAPRVGMAAASANARIRTSCCWMKSHQRPHRADTRSCL